MIKWGGNAVLLLFQGDLHEARADRRRQSRPGLVGDLGPDLRRAYTITDAVNLAARLMAKPEPDQILATDDVLSRSRTAFQTVALEPFQAEGTSEPPI